MNFRHEFRHLAVLLIAWAGLMACAAGQISAELSTRFLARGEKALLEISLPGNQASEYPRIPQVKGVTITPASTRPQTRIGYGRRPLYVFEYFVSSYETGPHTLPSFEVSSNGVTRRTEPIEFSVFNPDTLVWSTATFGSTTVRYATTFRVLDETPYAGESTPVEIKLFVPRDLFVEDWGIPDFERDGMNVWRFQPSPLRGRVNLLGMPYVSISYPSTLTAHRTGKVSLGPAKIRLISTEVVMRDMLRRVSSEANVVVPRIELDALPLPPGAPEGFDNAIGSFHLAVSSSTTEVHEGDPIAVDISISGSGNLNTLKPPQPVNPDGWKLYDATQEQRGDERRQLTGTTVFHQFMRPLELKTEIPPFRFVFFDPKLEAYQTLTSAAIPLQMTPVSPTAAPPVAPPQSLPVPVERMTDILGLIDTQQLTTTNGSRIPAWSGHLLAALVALGLVGKALWMRHGHKFRRDSTVRERQSELRRLSSQTADDRSFLVSVGAFIERWFGDTTDERLLEILNERDTRCFRKDASTDGILDSDRRRTILKTLRKAASVWTLGFLIVCTPTAARADDGADDLATLAHEAYLSARYDDAITLWLDAGPYESLSADTLYNIGNACYRLGSPGYAALYYRRALARAPGHQESLQNVRFIERKHGSITVHRPEYQDAIALVPLPVWKGALWSGLWASVIAALVFPATLTGARARTLAVVALAIGPLVAATGALGCYYFPDDSKFSPVENQVVIVGEDAVLHTDAARTSPEIIDAPPGSVAQIIRKSGRWAYIGFASKTRGWIPLGKIEPINPDSQPQPPKIDKPKATEKSA
ncbi:MAG: hypothetical protein ACQCXQ_12475 [Verrucomicrobiales bacterium]|nr:hypothetical protein [Verrucomicrobiota bacterium JB025]